MAKEAGEALPDVLADEALQLKKRARRRLIGAAALALLAAIVLPMVMDHQPAPPLKDIQVRIPSPDEGATQKIEPKAVAKAAPKAEAKPEAKAEMRDEAPKSEAKVEVKPELKPEPKQETAKTAARPETPQPARVAEKSPPAASVDKVDGEAWEVQLGAYQNSASVANLVGKLKQLGIPTYTEKVDTPAGARTRVRAGPFPSQEAAEKARTRIKIVGVDGPVAKKP